MTMSPPKPIAVWRRFSIAWALAALALFGLAFTPSAVRGAVFAKNAEQGITRFYEIETHTQAPDLTPKAAQIRLGYKPSRTPPRAEALPAQGAANKPNRHRTHPASPRAPPHEPRAPPVFS